MGRTIRAHRLSVEEGDDLAINLGSISRVAVDKIKNGIATDNPHHPPKKYYGRRKNLWNGRQITLQTFP